eukprot:4212832-Lingulodinium_polyedra.AAC.1
MVTTRRCRSQTDVKHSLSRTGGVLKTWRATRAKRTRISSAVRQRVAPAFAPSSPLARKLRLLRRVTSLAISWQRRGIRMGIAWQ